MAIPQNTAHAEESAEVEVLSANLDKLKSLTIKIQSSMDRLDVSGRVIQDALTPIYAYTQSLQTTSDNITKVNDAIDGLRRPLKVVEDEEATIRAGPRMATSMSAPESRDGTRKVDLATYLKSMQRIDIALREINDVKLRFNQKASAEVGLLLATGSSRLQDIFRPMLLEHAKIIEPLHYLTKNIRFPTIPQETAPILSSLCEAITSASLQIPSKMGDSTNPAIPIYAESRGPYIAGSLSNLATASVTTAKRKPTDGNYRQGTNGIGVYASALEGMIVAEYENVVIIFPAFERGKAIEAACHSAFSDLSSTLRDLNLYVKANIMTDCFLVFEILDIFTGLAYKVEAKELKLALSDTLKPTKDTAKYCLSQLLEETRRRAMSLVTLPADASPVPQVDETIHSLFSLTTYSHPLGLILTSIGQGNWQTPGGNNHAPLENPLNGKALLGLYLSDVIEALLSSLDSRSRAIHRTKLTQGAFLCNIVSRVTEMVNASPEVARIIAGISTSTSSASSLPSSSPHLSRLDSWSKRGFSIYLDPWRELSSCLLDTQHTNRGGAGPRASGQNGDSVAIVKSLSSKDREAIKEKFRTFNTTWEDLTARNRTLYFEPAIRDELMSEVQKLVEPMYARFCDRYHDIDKGRGKYIKFPKSMVAVQLANSFSS